MALKKIILIFIISFPIALLAQSIDPVSVQTTNAKNDSLVYIKLDQINVYPKKGRKLNYRRYTRMVAKIRKVYPFAKDAAKEMVIYNQKFEKSTSDRDKRKYVRHIERFLYEKYEDDLRRFTISEGRYLMLLIDRETGETSYSIIKEIKGGAPAFFWQGIAKLFRNDLKEKYDPIVKHYVIEQIVLMINEEERQANKFTK